MFTACTHDLSAFGVYVLFKSHAVVFAACNGAVSVFVTGKLPAFSYPVQRTVLAKFITQSCTSPEIVLKAGREFNNSHSASPFVDDRKICELSAV